MDIGCTPSNKAHKKEWELQNKSFSIKSLTWELIRNYFAKIIKTSRKPGRFLIEEADHFLRHNIGKQY
jgi:hypothetical protein